MGLYDFVKEAGKTIGMGQAEPSADDLKKELDSHGIGTSSLKVEKQGDTATLRGDAPNHDILEKAIVAIGNTIGVSKVETDVKVPADFTAARRPASTMYTVKKGDTLSHIAEAVYGKGKAAQSKAIFEANRPMLSNPDKIYPGQVLRVPPLAAKAAA
jgi:nucleoid-associated protein YgaU